MDMRSRKWFRSRRSRYIVFAVFFVCLVLAHVFGLFIHPFELDFGSQFKYPLDLDPFRDVVEVLKARHFHHDLDLNPELLQSLPKPINEYNYRFIVKNERKCSSMDAFSGNSSDSDVNSRRRGEDVTLLIVVKSALQNRHSRDAIRKSWGFEGRFSDVIIKRIFILGNCVDRSDVKDCQDVIDDEMNVHKDIVQADFVDSYYNNTIKTMVAIKWSVAYCSGAQFILFVDDDYYISIKNLLKYVRNPLNSWPMIDSNAIDMESNTRFDGRLYTGYLFPKSPPLRHKTSKWFVSLEEYPYSLYPPYITAGAFVLSNTSLIDMYFGSLYTKHFRFDDIYVGILAKKLSIIPRHNPNFYFWSLSYSASAFEDVIASHGFGDPKNLLIAWNQQKSLGFA